jgi:hypothetical protein
LRANSRLIVDCARPIRLAIVRADSPAATPAAMSSRSCRLSLPGPETVAAGGLRRCVAHRGDHTEVASDLPTNPTERPSGHHQVPDLVDLLLPQRLRHTPPPE